MIWKMAGSPKVTKSSKTFSDVTYPNNAINWATAKGIVGGYSDVTFKPNANTTRQQIATMLYKYYNKILKK